MGILHIVGALNQVCHGKSGLDQCPPWQKSYLLLLPEVESLVNCKLGIQEEIDLINQDDLSRALSKLPTNAKTGPVMFSVSQMTRVPTTYIIFNSDVWLLGA